MKKIFCFFFLFISSFVFAKEIPITLEYAKTEKERTFGLMQRPYLPENHGMLLVYPQQTNIQIWMLNCLIDLSVAFLDEKGVILEIHELKAYPNKISHPLKNYEEVMAYHDPKIFRFFLKNSIKSSEPSLYVLEMNKDWFKKYGVVPGNSLKTDLINPKAFIVQE
ncbi:MAG TPA: DUF192 domain-containing protein [Parachlamydiaceae bacterium]|nr:DUF192 domain-containing protein [Parachlamydiaceae bacterium]